MTWIVTEQNGRPASLPARIIQPQELKPALSPLAWKILQTLADGPQYPKELGKQLQVHEQKIYYHIRRLEQTQLVTLYREERRHGALTKYYMLSDPAFAVILKPLEPSTKLFAVQERHKQFLEPFIRNGRFNATFVIGSPEPHGPTKERGHDGIYATNLGLFFGTFLTYVPDDSIKLDTEMRANDLHTNLILIGGPAVNSITAKINADLPIRFSQVQYKNNFFDSFYSTISDKTYSEDSYGIIVKIANPFDTTKHVLVVAGRKFRGTQAAMLAFLSKFNELCDGNSYNNQYYARVVDGLDLNSDGHIDYVEFLE